MAGVTDSQSTDFNTPTKGEKDELELAFRRLSFEVLCRISADRATQEMFIVSVELLMFFSRAAFSREAFRHFRCTEILCCRAEFGEGVL